MHAGFRGYLAWFLLKAINQHKGKIWGGEFSSLISKLVLERKIISNQDIASEVCYSQKKMGKKKRHIDSKVLIIHWVPIHVHFN